MSVWGTGILKGLAITMKNMLRGPITLQYPHEKLELPERARWAVRMKLDEEGVHKCTACLACERACPDYIIHLDVDTDAERNKHINSYTYEIGACMMCGLCVEACPFDAIEMSHDYELARIDPETLTEQLLVDVDAAKPKKREGAARPMTPARKLTPSGDHRDGGELAAPVNPTPAEELERRPDGSGTPASQVPTQPAVAAGHPDEAETTDEVAAEKGSADE